MLAELRRAAFASLVPMPRRADAEHADAPPWLRLAVLPFPALLAEIERRGVMTLGTSLAGAPPAVVARAAASAGRALGAVVLEAARRSPAGEERERARALVAAAARAAETNVGSTTVVGLLALASELAVAAGAARVIAQRLPPRLGRIMRDPSLVSESEIRLHSGSETAARSLLLVAYIRLARLLAPSRSGRIHVLGATADF